MVTTLYVYHTSPKYHTHPFQCLSSVCHTLRTSFSRLLFAFRMLTPPSTTHAPPPHTEAAKEVTKLEKAVLSTTLTLIVQLAHCLQSPPPAPRTHSFGLPSPPPFHTHSCFNTHTLSPIPHTLLCPPPSPPPPSHPQRLPRR
jgi:hypothetical protein